MKNTRGSVAQWFNLWTPRTANGFVNGSNEISTVNRSLEWFHRALSSYAARSDGEWKMVDFPSVIVLFLTKRLRWSRVLAVKKISRSFNVQPARTLSNCCIPPISLSCSQHTFFSFVLVFHCISASRSRGLSFATKTVVSKQTAKFFNQGQRKKNQTSLFSSSCNWQQPNISQAKYPRLEDNLVF